MKKASYLLFLSGILLLSSCNDIIEKDITGDTPVVILPQANDTVAANPVHFKWEELEGATKYRLQIVSPSFANIAIYALDSVVSGTNFFYGLDSNQYEFRLTALNAGYESVTTAPITFWVGTSAATSTDVVQLVSPANNLYVNETFTGLYQWTLLPTADHYMFELHYGNSFAGQTVDLIPDIQSWTCSSYSGTQLAEDQYTWGVKAYMTDASETVYTKRTFYVDTTNPGLATLVLPVSNQTVSLSSSPSVTFSWTFPTDNGVTVSRAPVFATLEMSTNATFTNIVLSRPYAATLATATENMTTQGIPTGTYYWRIRLSDEAGNLGTAPTLSRLLNVIP